MLGIVSNVRRKQAIFYSTLAVLLAVLSVLGSGCNCFRGFVAYEVSKRCVKTLLTNHYSIPCSNRDVVTCPNQS